MQLTQRIRLRSVLDWIDRQPDRVSWPLGFALGMVPSLGMMLVSPTAGLVTGGLTLGAAVWLGRTGEPIALPLDDTLDPIEMVDLPGGEFWMGSPESEPERYHDEVRHRVRVSAFAMARYPVTQKLYAKVMGTNPSYFRGDGLPTENVSWFDAVLFCNKLSEKVGLRACYRIGDEKPRADQPVDGDVERAEPQVTWDRMADGYRLPTEAEWEYACRAGTESAYSFGDDPARLGEYGWFGGNSEGTTHEVGTKKPNGWGLFDLHGNVLGWCWDWYAEYQVTNDKSANSITISTEKRIKSTDPIGPSVGIRRVLRGGSFRNDPRFLRSADRVRDAPSHRDLFIGFRCVRNSGRQR